MMLNTWTPSSVSCMFLSLVCIALAWDAGSNGSVFTSGLWMSASLMFTVVCKAIEMTPLKGNR